MIGRMGKGRLLYFLDWPNQPYQTVQFHCPGCNREHPYRIISEGHTEAEVRVIFPNGCWSFNGNEESPTFTPSLLCEKDLPQYRCHLHVVEGRIKYEPDCHHDLKSKIVDMIPFPAGWED